MTKPRYQLRGQTSHVSRRCRGRRYLLKPTETMAQIMEYEVAHAAHKNGVEIAGVMTMANHFHIQLLDRRANRSAFMQKLVRALTFRLQPMHGLENSGGLWKDGQFPDIHKWGVSTELGTLLYIWLNPVAAGLVEKVRDWPGFKVLPEDWGKEKVVEKPEKYYGRSGPDQVTYTPLPPGCCRDMPLDDLVEMLNRIIGELEEHFAGVRRRKGASVMGKDAVMKLNPLDSPKTPSKRSYASARTGFSADSMACVEKMEKRYDTFLDSYETQRQKWLLGKTATFPSGTLKMRTQAPVTCRECPSDHPGIYVSDQAKAAANGNGEQALEGETQAGRTAQDSESEAAPTVLKATLGFSGEDWSVQFTVVDQWPDEKEDSEEYWRRRIDVGRKKDPPVRAASG